MKKIEISAEEFRETVKKLAEQGEKNAPAAQPSERERRALERERIKSERERLALERERIKSERERLALERERHRRRDFRARCFYIGFLAAVALAWIIWEIVFIVKFT